MVAARNDSLRVPAVAVLWAMLGVVAVEIVVTYSRIPPAELYSVSGTGLGAGCGRALVFLNFPVALAALPVIALAADRLRRAPALVAGLHQERVRLRAAPSLLLLPAIPWLAAELSFHLDGVPVLGWIFLTGKVVGVRAAVHLGHHHGMDGVLLTLAALLLVPLVRRIRARGLRLLVGLYLGLQIASSPANAAQDGWLEQVAKRGWTTHVIPSVLHPALTLPWLGIAVAAAVFAALILRPAPVRRSGRFGPRRPSSLRATPGAARDG